MYVLMFIYIYTYVYMCWYTCITFQSYTWPFGTCKELLVYHRNLLVFRFIWDRKDWEFMLWCHLEGRHLWQEQTCCFCIEVVVLGCPVGRINGLFHLLINGVYWGYNPLTNHLLTSWDIQVVDPYLMPEIMSHGTNDSHTCLRILFFQIGARLCLVFVQDSHPSWFLDVFEKSTCCWFGVELFSENTSTPFQEPEKTLENSMQCQNGNWRSCVVVLDLSPHRTFARCQWQVKVNSQTPDRLIVHHR